MSSADATNFVDSLRLENGPDGLRIGQATARTADEGVSYVIAGRLGAYIAHAAASAYPERELRSVRCMFLRPVRPGPFAVSTTALYMGKSFGAVTIGIEQDDKLCAYGVVTSGPLVPDIIHHEAPSAAVTSAAESSDPSPDIRSAAAPIRVVGGVDPFDPNTEQEPRWQVWLEASTLPDDVPGIREAYLVYHANSFLVQASVLAHKGISQHSVHDDLLTAITGCEVVFHQPQRETDWLLFDQQNDYAGGGWVFGHGAIFSEDGRRIASFSEDVLLRALPEGRVGTGGLG
jgi:acyl-CoA thioesterase II